MSRNFITMTGTNRKADSVRKMIFRLLQLLALWSHLSQCCNVRYTRSKRQRKLFRRNWRGARTQNQDNLPIPGIPGIPGEDFPLHTVIPDTPFSCEGRMDGGFYGDPGPESRCQVFHRCVNDGKANLVKHSFLCPIGAQFRQKDLVCDWWHKVDCSATEDFYDQQLKREERSRTPINPDSCTVLRSWDPMGKQGGAPEATGCERVFGLYPSLENVPPPYSFKSVQVNDCEKLCLQRAECTYYVYDCKMELCELKMGNTDGSLVNDTRYVTGKKTSRAPKECQGEETTETEPSMAFAVKFKSNDLSKKN